MDNSMRSICFPEFDSYTQLISNETLEQSSFLGTLDSHTQPSPSLSAIGGALAAQEAIKAVTSENQPILGLLVLDSDLVSSRIIAVEQSTTSF